MPRVEPTEPSPSGNNHAFPVTRWSVVVQALNTGEPAARRALQELCGSYWPPLYAFIRRSGFSREDAEDLTQDFVKRLVERELFSAADATKGKLRTFLLAALKNFLKDFRKFQGAKKRGGDAPVLSIDQLEAEQHYKAELVDAETPATLFERHWAQAVLDAVFQELAEDYDSAGKGELFDALSPYLIQNSGEACYSDVGARIGMKEGAVKVAVFRMRNRFKKIFYERVLETVSDESEVNDEIAFFFKVLKI